MPSTVLIGAQWGDEGKGKVTDLIAREYDYVVRYQGGNNAGHTVIHGDKKLALHLMPSGVMYEHAVPVIGNGVVVDPGVLIKEMAMLEAEGISCKNLKISCDAHVIMPYHKDFDGADEKRLGENKIGTTKRGIGPCYQDKAARKGIRIQDLLDEKIFRLKLETALAQKNPVLQKIYGLHTYTVDEICEEYLPYARILKPYMAETAQLLNEAVRAGKSILFEGAQGTLLDIDYGTYPFVTSSHPVSGGVCVGSGVGPTLIDEVVGAAKAYTTRVGAGPFPTELLDETGDEIRNRGHEFGTVTGRPRRCGWFDAVIMRHSVRINGLTALAINKIDTLSGMGPLKVCTAYRKSDGTILRDFPATIEELAECSPVYEELDGFDGDLSGCRSFDELPESCKKYIAELERLCECPITMVGVGPSREQNLERI